MTLQLAKDRSESNQDLAKQVLKECPLLAQITLCILISWSNLLLWLFVILIYTTFLDILDRNFGVTDTRKCANLDDHFSQYVLALLTCTML